jgi:hypothetical protein
MLAIKPNSAATRLSVASGSEDCSSSMPAPHEFLDHKGVCSTPPNGSGTADAPTLRKFWNSEEESGSRGNRVCAPHIASQSVCKLATEYFTEDIDRQEEPWRRVKSTGVVRSSLCE